MALAQRNVYVLAKVLLLSSATLLASGCSWLVHDRDDDYLASEIKPAIKVPSDLARVQLKPQLPIPDVKSKAALAEEFELPRPAPLVIEDQEETASLAEDQSQTLTANLVKDGNGTPILRLNVGFARAWASLGESLKKSEIDITDLNRSIGTYYIELIDESAQPEQGFWASLFGSEPEAVKLPFQVKLNRARSGVYVALHVDQDNLAEDAEANRVLTILKDHI